MQPATGAVALTAVKQDFQRNEIMAMPKRLGFIPALTLLLGVLMATDLHAAEYFVSTRGADTNDGLSKDAAFLTIQKGVDALKPGDTLTICPGEYAESVFRARLGDAEVDTIIRAEIPGTVLLRGDVPAPEFKKVEGYRFVYAAPLDQEPEAVLEYAAMKLLKQRPNAAELEFEPGSFFYDADARMLYVSSEDQKDLQGRRYSIGVEGRSGLHLEEPKRVVVEGLSAVGYYRGMARRPGRWVEDYQWGIVLDLPTSCTVRDCRAFLNCAGIGLNNGRGNVVEGCVAHDNVEHNIQYFGGDNNMDNVARDCRAYRGGWGIDYYTTFSGPVFLRDCVAWGHFMDYSTKGTDSAEYAFMENCVALSDIRIHNMKNCIFGGGYNEYMRAGEFSRDNIIFNEEEDLCIDREFADPINMDWRLQGDSRFRGAREDGKDRGVFPEHDYTIYFLAPTGSDANDGASLGKAWKTFNRAAKALQPGDTLYLSAGVYETEGRLTLGRAGAEPVRIRGRGRDRLVIQGPLNVAGSAGVEFERLAFAENVIVEDGQDIAFANCTFNGLNSRETRGLKITHSLFAGTPLRLTTTSGTYLSGNIFANAVGSAVVLEGENAFLYSDYNSYQGEVCCWEVKGRRLSFEDLRESHDRYSEVLKPELSMADARPEVTNVDTFAGRGPHGTSLGRHQEYEEERLSVVGPFVHSVTDTTANIEWWTSGPATCELTWGETPAMENAASSLNKHKVSSVSMQTYRFTSFSLTGLKPGRKYYFAIRKIDPVTQETAMPLASVTLRMEPLTFMTATKSPEPRTYYVAPDGNDAKTGLSREKAWRTVGHAASQVNAGDTVMIAGGTYREMVRVRATGAPDKPVTFRCMPGEKVIFDGDERSLQNAFVVNQKQYINLDGFYFTNYDRSVIAVFVSGNVRITRCFSDGRGPGYAGPLLIVRNSSDVVVRNCVSIDGFGEGIYMNHVPGMLIEHNVFLRNLIFGFILENDAGEKVTMRQNICADSLPFKSQVPYFSIAHVESLVEKDNCYYMRLPDEERAMFQFYDSRETFGGRDRVGLEEFQKVAGDTGSFRANPWFKGTLGMEEGETVEDRGVVYPVILSDKLVNKPDLDFPDLFATDPKLVEKGIGLVPADFEDFGFDER